MEYTSKDISEMMHIYANLVKYDALFRASQGDINETINTAANLKYYMERFREKVPEEVRAELQFGNSIYLKDLESLVKKEMDGVFNNQQ